MAENRDGLDRTQPHNLDAEKAALGCAFVSAAAADGLFEALSADDFYRPAHSRIFAAMAELRASGTEVNHVSVSDRLEAMGCLDQSGGKPYLLDLTGTISTAAAWRSYAEIVHRTSVLRKLIAAGTNIVALGYDAPDDIPAVIDAAVSLVPTDETRSQARTIGEIGDAVLGEYVTQHPTYDIREFGIRMRSSTVTVLAGKTGTGKSALALHGAVEMASRGVKVRIYSYELADHDWAIRCIAREFGMQLEALERGVGVEGVESLKSELRTRPWSPHLSIVDCVHPRLWTPSQLIADMRRFRREGGRVGVIDYLQIMKSQQRFEDVTDSSTTVRIAARQSDLAVLLLSQVKRVDGRIGMNDLRQSGSIEQDADDVLLLNETDDKMRAEFGTRRYHLSDPIHDGKTLVDLTFAKRRRGKKGYTIPLFFDGAEQRFAALDQDAS